MMKRLDEPTPNGGDYSILVTLDENFNDADEEKAVIGFITEYKANGDMIFETIGFLKDTKINFPWGQSE